MRLVRLFHVSDLHFDMKGTHRPLYRHAIGRFGSLTGFPIGSLLQGTAGHDARAAWFSHPSTVLLERTVFARSSGVGPFHRGLTESLSFTIH